MYEREQRRQPCQLQTVSARGVPLLLSRRDRPSQHQCCSRSKTFQSKYINWIPKFTVQTVERRKLIKVWRNWRNYRTPNNCYRLDCYPLPKFLTVYIFVCWIWCQNIFDVETNWKINAITLPAIIVRHSTPLHFMLVSTCLGCVLCVVRTWAPLRSEQIRNRYTLASLCAVILIKPEKLWNEMPLLAPDAISVALKHAAQQSYNWLGDYCGCLLACLPCRRTRCSRFMPIANRVHPVAV